MRKAIGTANSFADLIGIVASIAEGVSGLGELYIYDTALRIGAKSGLEPDMVYLHAGTRKGAKALGLDASMKTSLRGVDFGPSTIFRQGCRRHSLHL
jgi:hypothetical protein